MSWFIDFVAKPGLAAAYIAAVTLVVKRRSMNLITGKGWPQGASVWRKLLSTYLTFALAHHVAKMFSFFKSYWRAYWGWRQLPGKFMDLGATELLKNQHRINDWRFDTISKYYGTGSPIVKANWNEVVMMTPEAVEWMLKNEFQLCTKADRASDPGFRLLADFVGDDGIFVLRHGDSSAALQKDNALWYSQRKTASKIFTKSNFTSLMCETFEAKAKTLIKVLEVSAEQQTKVDMQQHFFNFTMDSIQKIFFNRDVDSAAAGKADEFGAAFDVAQTSLVQEFIASLPVFILSRAVLPFPFGDIGQKIDTSLLWQFQRHVVSKPMKVFRQNVNKIHSFAEKLIKETKADTNLPERRDLMANFLNGKDSSKLTDKLLKDIVLSMILAGRDTTACTLTWLFFILTQNPDVQDKLCEEIDEKLQGRVPTVDDLSPKNMPYLNGVLYETLRLYPPVPEDEKVIAKDGVNYVDGTPLYKDTHVVFVPYSMGRNPHVYPNPEKVDPNRWIPFNTPNPYAFPVFQAGPRFCLGKDMAQLEAKFLTAMLLQNFKFRLLEGEAEKITYSLMITLSLCNSKLQDSTNLWLIPTKR